MRMNRTVSALLGVAMLGLTPLATAGTADAAPSAGMSKASTMELSKPHRKVTEGMKKVNGHIRFFGRVTPNYGNKIVYIQRKHNKGGVWKVVDRDRTTSTGRYSVGVGAPRTGRWYFRAKVPGNAHYATSFSAGNYYTYRV